MLEKSPSVLQDLLVPVVLCGGSGTRLWPLSRVLYPKHVISLFAGASLLEGTLRRIQELGSTPPTLILSNANQRFIVAEQADRVGAKCKIIVEPVSRNTAPAVTVAALAAAEEMPEAILAVMPSDHVIRNERNFKQALYTATLAASSGKLVTFGIPPTAAKTGYGYIVRGTEDARLEGCFTVEAFTEKPSKSRAEALIHGGNAYWNSGIFVFSANIFLEEVASYAPELLAACTAAWQQRKEDRRFTWLDQKAFETAPQQPVDVAVMEKTKRAAVVMEDLDWDDVGAWSSLWNIGPRNEDGNVLTGDAFAHDVRNCYINAQDTLVGAVGVEDLVIVATDDSVLITRRDRSEDVKILVSLMQEAGRSETERHNKVFKPWGNYKTISQGSRYLSKIITVNPGERLSRQMHHHRAEHWIVVCGVALVERGDEKILLHENESVYLPTGCYHRLENPGKIPLVLIEVQTGSYLAEDDIVRVDDDYDRKPAD